jgi:hypothetical protein
VSEKASVKTDRPDADLSETKLEPIFTISSISPFYQEFSLVLAQFSVAARDFRMESIGASPSYAIELVSLPGSKTPRDDSPAPLRRTLDDGSYGTGAEAQSLPPVDRGKDAWFFLGSCWLLEVSPGGRMVAGERERSIPD